MNKEELELDEVSYLKKLLKWRTTMWRLQFANLNAIKEDIHLIQEVMTHKVKDRVSHDQRVVDTVEIIQEE